MLNDAPLVTAPGEEGPPAFLPLLVTHKEERIIILEVCIVVVYTLNIHDYRYI